MTTCPALIPPRIKPSNPLGRGTSSRGGLNPHTKLILVSESGFYRLIFRSDKPEARVFQDWVARVVLPAIRRDGVY
ncbi:MAG TPA: BRO family protein, partial [Bradyrhizobium sp.]|nr:BRO family protein [Bradyrhizobium sp.]